MWFLEEAQRGYQELEEKGSFMGDTVEVGLELARKYRDRANPHTQWVKAEMIEDPTASTPARICWRKYLSYGEASGMWRRQKPESYDDFKMAMRNLGYTVKRPTSHKDGMGVKIFGLCEKTFSAEEMAQEEED